MYGPVYAKTAQTGPVSVSASTRLYVHHSFRECSHRRLFQPVNCIVTMGPRHNQVVTSTTLKDG